MVLRLRAALAAVILVACSKNDPPAEQPVTVDDTGTEAATDDAPADTHVSTFAKGPYGTSPRDVAGPFVAPTTTGDWSFEDHFTGEDHYVFVAYLSTNAYSKGLLKGPYLTKLLAASPKNVHYFFLYRDDKPTFDAWVATATPLLDAYWKDRVHFVTQQADALPGWLGDVFRERTAAKLTYERNDRLHFAVDRTQHVREVGMLGRLSSSGTTPDLSFLASEPTYYEFEYAREQKLAAAKANVVPVFKDATVVETIDTDVTLPDAATMATYDTLEVDLSTNCEHHRDGECGAWDYISDLRICTEGPPDDAGAPTLDCGIELARWITSYWREGRWVTDISGMLPFLADGGKKKLRWYASKQWDPRPANYVASLSLRFSNTGKGMKPVSAKKLFEGNSLNDSYASHYPPLALDIPADTKKAELYALITGHGSETDQCAEFCNHTHHFRLNGGTEHVLDFPMAQSADGCRKRVNEGVVPNQFGTWYFGRGGWCPGFDVAPFRADLTADVKATNTLTYEAFIGTTPPAAGSTYGNIHMTTYLVLWK
ncbi:MAG: peptide-N-glycosidase F-related protein [Polyangiales bacterium]